MSDEADKIVEQFAKTFAEVLALYVSYYCDARPDVRAGCEAALVEAMPRWRAEVMIDALRTIAGLLKQ